jgi:hypothetical protein
MLLVSAIELKALALARHIIFKATLNKSLLLALFSGRESEVNSDSLPPSQSLA